MGASQSKSLQRFQQQVENRVVANCPRTVCSNETEVGDITVGGRRNTARIIQRCNATADCIMNHTINTAAQSIANASSDAKAGIGLSNANTTQDITVNLRNRVEQNCGSTESRNKVKVGNIKFLKGSDGNLVEIAQIGDAKSQCALGLMSDMFSKIDATASSKSSGWDPLSFLTNPIFLIVAGIVLVFLIFMVILF